MSCLRENLTISSYGEGLETGQVRHVPRQFLTRQTSYGELGSELTLRSRTVEGGYQEIWGALIAYNLIRREIASAAWEAKLAPTDISFVRALHTIQHEMMWAALTPAYAKLPACLQRLRDRLKSLPNEKRPGRACDRVVKSRPKRYTVRYLNKDIN